MVISRQIYYALLGGLATERLFELWLSRRHAQSSFIRGGVEVGHRQYRIMVVFHTLFIMACAVEASLRNRPFPPAASAIALIGEAASQALRYWSIAALGESWNTRVIVIPNSSPVTAGPDR